MKIIQPVGNRRIIRNIMNRIIAPRNPVIIPGDFAGDKTILSNHGCAPAIGSVFAVSDSVMGATSARELDRGIWTVFCKYTTGQDMDGDGIFTGHFVRLARVLENSPDIFFRLGCGDYQVDLLVGVERKRQGVVSLFDWRAVEFLNRVCQEN